MKASLIIIGNEILSGRTQDKNLSYLANWLNEIGIQLTEVRVIRDEEDVIVETVNHLRKLMIMCLPLVVLGQHTTTSLQSQLLKHFLLIWK